RPASLPTLFPYTTLFRSAVLVLLIGEFDQRDAIGQLQRRLEALGQPPGHVGGDHEPVDHHFDIVLELLVERRGVLDLVILAIDLDRKSTRLNSSHVKISY